MAKEKTPATAGSEAAAPAGAPEVAKPSAPRKSEKPESPASDGAGAPPAPTAAVTTAASDGAAKKKRKPGVPPRRGKKLRNQIKNVRQRLDKEGAMPLKKAVNTLKSLKRVKFDESVEIHCKLGIDPTQSDQMVRGSVPLPFGLGKVKRVVVFCQGDNVGKAKDAGADFAGGSELIERIQKENWLDFDVALATQDMMGQVSRLGKILGPRGLMPTPKGGTVVPANGDVAAAVREQKAGKVEYRSDKVGTLHASVGKLSFDEDKLVANIQAFIDQVRAAKPAAVKGHFVETITVSATMSPGIRVTM